MGVVQWGVPCLDALGSWLVGLILLFGVWPLSVVVAVGCGGGAIHTLSSPSIQAFLAGAEDSSLAITSDGRAGLSLRPLPAAGPLLLGAGVGAMVVWLDS